MTEFHEVFLAAHPVAGIILFLYLREFLNSFHFQRDQENSHIFKYSSAFQDTKTTDLIYRLWKKAYKIKKKRNAQIQNNGHFSFN